MLLKGVSPRAIAAKGESARGYPRPLPTLFSTHVIPPITHCHEVIHGDPAEPHPDSRRG
jgi:hypothetical protein